ncbi:hypothetical protein [Geminocystis herdmanii]|uniref:hypothetical protein n=1 Tax=Geminocystis herdmanii TaxID=669359 RepID=UPI000349CA7E|nr:hypothetical protein [Geminocystis herdmanii]
MKIIQQNSNLLSLGYSSKIYLGRLFLLLFGSPFFLVGIWVILSIGKVHILKCDRIEINQISCGLIQQGLISQKKTNIPRLYNAKLGIDSDGDSPTYRVELDTNMGMIPLSIMYSSGEKNKANKVSKINEFIQNINENSLTIKQDDRLFAYSFGGLFALAGSGLMMGGLTHFRKTNIIFNKSMGKMLIEDKNLFQNQVKEYRLGEIKKVTFVKEYHDSHEVFRPKIMLNRGEEILLPLKGDSTEQEAIIQNINNFLGLIDLNK